MKVLYCDDQEIIRQGIKNMLQSITSITQMVPAETCSEVLLKVKNNDFDIVLLDISLPDGNGLDVLKQIKEIKPDTKVIMLSVHTQKQYVTRALDRKASGFLTKDVISSELATAIKTVMNNEIYISPSLTALFVKPVNNTSGIINNGLSERELEVLDLLGMGKKNKEISEILKISPKTVNTHRSNIMTKMNFKTIADLIHYYKEYRADPNSLP